MCVPPPASARVIGCGDAAVGEDHLADAAVDRFDRAQHLLLHAALGERS